MSFSGSGELDLNDFRQPLKVRSGDDLKVGRRLACNRQAVKRSDQSAFLLGREGVHIHARPASSHHSRVMQEEIAPLQDRTLQCQWFAERDYSTIDPGVRYLSVNWNPGGSYKPQRDSKKSKASAFHCDLPPSLERSNLAARL